MRDVGEDSAERERERERETNGERRRGSIQTQKVYDRKMRSIFNIISVSNMFQYNCCNVVVSRNIGEKCSDMKTTEQIL
jgi:hypothetical protein